MVGELRHVLERLPRYARLAWELERDARVGRGRKTALALAACYSVSPLDLIPGFLPVVGQLDDLLVLLWGIRHTLDRLPVTVREEHLRRAGVTREEVDADYRRVRAAIGTIARGTGRMAGRAAASMLRFGVRAGYQSLRVGYKGVRAGYRGLRPRHSAVSGGSPDQGKRRGNGD